MNTAGERTAYLQSIADNFPHRSSTGTVLGWYLYEITVNDSRRIAGPFATQEEANEWATKPNHQVTVGPVFTASGKIVKAA